MYSTWIRFDEIKKVKMEFIVREGMNCACVSWAKNFCLFVIILLEIVSDSNK